jgi:hypothetical protein
MMMSAGPNFSEQVAAAHMWAFSAQASSYRLTPHGSPDSTRLPARPLDGAKAGPTKARGLDHSMELGVGSRARLVSACRRRPAVIGPSLLIPAALDTYPRR